MARYIIYHPYENESYTFDSKKKIEEFLMENDLDADSEIYELGQQQKIVKTCKITPSK